MTACRIMFVAILVANVAVVTGTDCRAGETATNGPAGRTWTSVGGQTIEAEFVKLEYGNVHLRTPEGKIIRIRKTLLSREDQEAVATLATSAAKPKRLSLSAKSSSQSPTDILSDEEVAKLQTVWSDDDKARIEFKATMKRRRLSKKYHRMELKRYARSGKIPYVVRADMLLREEKKGKTRTELLNERARFYIIDEEGTLLVKKSMRIDKLRAASDGKGGYFGEVAKAGKYTLVMWVQDKKKGNFGAKIAVELKAFREPE